MSAVFQHELWELKRQLLALAASVEAAIAKAFQALLERDERAAQEVIDADREIDRMEVIVEEHCLRTIACQQPVARDLRFLVAVLKINNDLERMGDLAKNIAKGVRRLASVPTIAIPAEFQAMMASAQAMVKGALDAVTHDDLELAQKIRADDDEVDRMRNLIYDQLRAHVREQPEQTDILMKLFAVARNVERLADMATHIAEEVIYMVKGDIVRHSGSEA